MPDRSRPPAPREDHDDGGTLRALSRAIELQQQGRLDEAESLYAKLLAKDDRDPTLLINAGVLAMARDDIAAAIARLERATSIAPANGIAFGHLGKAFARAERREEAMRAFQRALALQPGNVEVALRLRELTRSAGDA